MPTPKVDRDLDHLYPEFARRIRLVLDDVNHWCAKHAPKLKVAVHEGLRSVARQQQLYAQGRSTKGNIVTWLDGVTKESRHQSGLAVDIVPKRGAVWTWGSGKSPVPDELWAYLGHCARKHGLVWGGDWPNARDKPHVEWNPKDRLTRRLAKQWLLEKGLQ